MGYFLGLGERQFFVEDDGTYWNGSDKKIQYSEKDLYPERFVEDTVTVAVVEEPKVETVTVIEHPVAVEIPEATITISDQLKCDCGFIAKSNAGSAAHKRKCKEKQCPSATITTTNL